MVRRPAALCVAAAAVACGAGAAEEPLRQDFDPQREVVRRVEVPLRIWNRRAGEFVIDPGRLDLDRFVLMERGGPDEPFVRQTPLSLEPDTRPLSVVLAIDLSGSMVPAMESVRRAAGDLAARLRPDDRVAVLSFNDRVVFESDLTGDPDTVRDTLDGLYAWGFTALYDALLTGLERLADEPGPRALVVLTDGEDNRSYAELGDVVERAEAARIPIFVVFHQIGRSKHAKLADAAERSGGHVFTTRNDRQLIEAFETISFGFRHTLRLTYRSTNTPAGGAWREISVRYRQWGFRVDTHKRGYLVREAPLAGVPADIEPPPPEWPLYGPVPELYCRKGYRRDVRGWCGEGIAARPSDDGGGLVVEGWVDLAHAPYIMLHPTEYAVGRPLPPRPHDARRIYWGPFRKLGRLDFTVDLPPPDALPRGPAELMRRVLAEGGTFRALGMEGEPGWRSREAGVRAFTLDPVPGMAPLASGEPATFSWLDGMHYLAARGQLSRWIVLARPEYRDWLRERFDAETDRQAAREIDTVLGRLPETFPAESRAALVERTRRELAAERADLWKEIASGRAAYTRRLLTGHRDLHARDLMQAAEAALIDAVVEAPPEPARIEADWLAPAAEAWTRLRTFLAPTAHQSLTLAHPFLDETRGEIYFPRVLLPQVDDLSGADVVADVTFRGFPPPRPQAFEMVASVLAEPDGAAYLAGYRCPGDGVDVWESNPYDVGENPGDWWARLERLEAERSRVRGERREEGGPAVGELESEARRLRREIRSMRTRVTRRTSVRLEREDAPGVGLLLARVGDDDLRATPLADPGITAEIGPREYESLEAAVRESGYDVTEPGVANALVAARLSGYRDGALGVMLRADGPLACFEPERRPARLLFRPGDLPFSRPPRIVVEEGREVLEINLVASSRRELVAAAVAACRGGGRR